MKKKVVPKKLLPPVGVKRINPRGATALIATKDKKKKVGLYGLI